MIQMYNTLSRKSESFKSRRSKRVNLFVCGITAYDFSHIGHARTYIAFDMIAKYLRQKGYNVLYVQNVTDVDDKIIKRAQELKEDPKKLAFRFEKEYRADMRMLGVSAPTKYARATDYIPEIIDQVRRLLKKGYAYEILDDGIYFDISKFREYGKLSGRTQEQAQDAVSRIDESVNKRSKGDFALWKLSKPGEPKWKSPWGFGRPGWHIEDTAIGEKFFGPQYDIHGGAQDLIFPHHEAEITQMEAVSGKKPFVKYWMHTGFLTVKGEKMSKSLGNFVTIRDFLASPKSAPGGRRRVNQRARLLRFFVLKTHYRSLIDYSEGILQQSESELGRLDEFVDRLREKSEIQNPKSKTNSIRQLADKMQNPKLAFDKAMEDDFNTPLAVSILFDLIREGNSLMDAGKLSKADAKTILDFFKQIDEFFGFIFWRRGKQTIPAEIQKLAAEREKYRKQKNWAKADELRKQLEQLGWVVEDTPPSYKLKKLIYQK